MRQSKHLIEQQSEDEGIDQEKQQQRRLHVHSSPYANAIPEYVDRQTKQEQAGFKT